MLVEVWSDVVCPWCYIGTARLRRTFPHADVAHRAFELDPRHGGPRPVKAVLQERYGPSADVDAMFAHVTDVARQEGLELRLDRSVSANSFDAHRLVRLASRTGLGETVLHALMRAHFTDGLDISDHGVLRGVAVAAGVAPDAVDALLGSDQFAGAVRADEAAARALQVTGVPFFLFAGRFGVAGAQPAAVLQQAAARSVAAPGPV